MMALAVGLSTDELMKLNAAFLEIDTNNDGLIEHSEFSVPPYTAPLFFKMAQK